MTGHSANWPAINDWSIEGHHALLDSTLILAYFCTHVIGVIQFYSVCHWWRGGYYTLWPSLVQQPLLGTIAMATATWQAIHFHWPIKSLNALSLNFVRSMGKCYNPLCPHSPPWPPTTFTKPPAQLHHHNHCMRLHVHYIIHACKDKSRM